MSLSINNWRLQGSPRILYHLKQNCKRTYDAGHEGGTIQAALILRHRDKFVHQRFLDKQIAVTVSTENKHYPDQIQILKSQSEFYRAYIYQVWYFLWIIL